MNTLSKRAQLRLLRFVGDHAQGVDLWVELRQPIRLYGELEKMAGVVEVSNVWQFDPQTKERRLELRLDEGPTPGEVETPSPEAGTRSSETEEHAAGAA